MTLELGVGPDCELDGRSDDRPFDYSGAPTRRRTVLVLEDDPVLRELVGLILSDEGYVAVAVGTAAEADRVVHERPIDVIVTDYVDDTLGEVDALAIQPLLRRWPGVPMILCSGRRGIERLNPCSIGLSAIVPKPFDVEVLLRAIETAAISSAAVG